MRAGVREARLGGVEVVITRCGCVGILGFLVLFTLFFYPGRVADLVGKVLAVVDPICLRPSAVPELGPFSGE